MFIPADWQYNNLVFWLTWQTLVDGDDDSGGGGRGGKGGDTSIILELVLKSWNKYSGHDAEDNNNNYDNMRDCYGLIMAKAKWAKNLIFSGII